ncbi:mucoidy inhibitor MuiA family protein [Wenyingzhuangia sp. IMCC45574]
MKKNISILFALFVFTHISFSQNAQNIKSKVNSATVFLNKAQVNRTVKVPLKKGISLINFEKLSPFIDAKSIQVKVNPSVHILSVNHKKNFINKTKKSEKVKVLEAKIDKIQDQITLANTESDIITQNIDFLQKNKMIGGTNQTLTVSNLRQTADYYANQYKKFRLERLTLNQKIDDLRDEKSKLQKEIRTISTTKDHPTGEIFVKVETTKEETGIFEITYLVGNVSWFPSYDIKATNINEPLHVTYKANLQQNSQVDWTNINISFSSDDPKTSSVAPELTPYKLSFNQRRGRKSKEKITQVAGTIFGDDNEPLIGATVNAIGSNINTATDFDGKYSLSIPNNTNSLQASYLGYKSQVKSISSDVVNFRLQAEAGSLDEVVVVGYGTQKKKEITGAVASVNADNIRIRGINSISGNNQPLYVVDGIPYDSDPNLSPDDIASIDVLKDGASSAIYGTRSAGGVILITTKNGMNATTTLSQTAVNFNLNKKQTFKSDVKAKEIKLTTLNIPAEYQYFTVPKINKSAYLIAKIKNWEQYQLLDGETNIFFDNTFKSKGLLDLSSIKDEIIISLGVDKQINIDRTQTDQNTDRKFLSKNVETLKHWKVTIKNNKNEDINIQVLDQVPVSIVDAIKVEVLTISDAKLDDKSGELKWNLSIPKRTATSLDIVYKVTHPKNRKLIIE